MIKKSVLVVDDEEAYLNSLKRGFKISSIKDEINLTCLTSVDKAVKYINNSSPDIALIDMRMPHRAGGELIDILLKLNRPPYIIIITGNSSVSEAISYLKKGVYDYISKPINMDELILKLSHILKTIDKEVKIEDLTKEISILKPKKELITTAKKMEPVLKMIKSAQESDFPVLILGESGTGKEIVADKIHYGSQRKNNAFIKINSAGIVSTLLESEMFGYEKGAFTGANKTKPGKFELADKGTLFLDEIGDMDVSLQVKLLRTLQEGTFQHLGGTKELTTDTRIITATNKNLRELIKTGDFREDLFYRLNIIAIEIPPLRERKEDISLLISNFLNTYKQKYNKQTDISYSSLKILESWDFPGNVRELENIIASSFALCNSKEITPEDLPAYLMERKREKPPEPVNSFNLEEHIRLLEENLINRCLKDSKFNKSEAAQKLGISRRQLYYKMQKLGIE